MGCKSVRHAKVNEFFYQHGIGFGLYLCMVKQVTIYLLLVLIVVIGDRLAGYLLQNINAGSQFRYSRLYHQRAEADILLAGNSRGLTFYQPHIESSTGKKTFNLSYNGLPANLAEVLVSDYLDLYPQVEQVIVDITLADRQNKELIAGFLPYLDRSERLNRLLQKETNDAWYGSKVSALFRYNNEVFQRAYFYKNKPDTDWLIDRVIAPELAATAPLDTFPISVQPALIESIRKITEYARQKNKPVRLVISPYYPGFVKDWSNLDRFKQAIETATGLKVEDYRQALTDPTDFGDFMHANKKGAIRYMDLLFGKTE